MLGSPAPGWRTFSNEGWGETPNAQLTDWRTAMPLKNLHTRTYFLNQSRSDLLLPFKCRFGSKTQVFDRFGPGF